MRSRSIALLLLTLLLALSLSGCAPQSAPEEDAADDAVLLGFLISVAEHYLG